jgi:hypothetical protein
MELWDEVTYAVVLLPSAELEPSMLKVGDPSPWGGLFLGKDKGWWAGPRGGCGEMARLEQRREVLGGCHGLCISAGVRRRLFFPGFAPLLLDCWTLCRQLGSSEPGMRRFESCRPPGFRHVWGPMTPEL